MTTPAVPSSTQPSGDKRNAAATGAGVPVPSLEDKLGSIWKNQRKAILALGVAVLAGIVVFYVWDMYSRSQEEGIGREFASADTPARLQAFTEAHKGHALAGLAFLTMGDDAYTDGKYADAIVDYDRASAILKTGPFGARAKLGSAMATLGSGKADAAEAALKKLASDAGGMKAIRVEATYQLASLAVDAGRSDDVTKYTSELLQIDPNSAWTQRAMSLRAEMPASASSTKTDVPANGNTIKLN